MRRCIGLDVHREFAQVAIWEDGIVRQAGPIKTTPEELRAFAENLGPNDEVALEATCNTYAIATLLERYVAQIVISNPKKTRAIAETKVRPTRSTRSFLPSSLLPTTCQRYGFRTRTLTPFGARSPVAPTSCASALGSRTRFRPSCSDPVPRCPTADLFGHKGRAWLHH
jgi:transposase